MASMTLDELVSQLRKVYADELRAVVLYGSAAAGAQIPKRSDYNVLVLTGRLDLDTLTRESAVARAWGEAGNPPPLTMTVDEWRRSADVFPMEYADILEHHRVLHGEIPLDGVEVDPRDLRLQVEREALGKLLKLRGGILAAGGDRKRLAELLAASFSTFMVLFRAVLRAHGERPPTDYEALCARVAERARLDAKPFLAVLRHLRNGAKVPEPDIPDVLAGYLAGAQQLVAHIDQLGSR